MREEWAQVRARIKQSIVYGTASGRVRSATIATVRRILFAVNVLIALIGISAIAGYYWIFVRALPETSGTIQTFVASKAEVARDGLGSHITAGSIDDALFVDGYVAAGDRMWQMDILRRYAGGELSEILGPTTLEADREARRIRMRRIAKQTYSQLSNDEKRPFAAYARGVNAYIESHRGRYGFEFTLLRYDPRPWTTVDSLLIGLQLFRQLTNDWKTKLIKEQMLRSGEPDKSEEFSVPDAERPGIHAGQRYAAGFERLARSPGSHTTSGKPLLSSDAHLEFAIPGIWHMTHLRAPGLNVAGLEFPGVPGVIHGHNDRIAREMTNLGFDVQELDVEKLDLYRSLPVSGSSGAGAGRRRADSVKGQATKSFSAGLRATDPSCIGRKEQYPEWIAAESGLFQFPFIEIDRARTGVTSLPPSSLPVGRPEFRLRRYGRQYRLSGRGQIADPGQL